MAQAWPDVWAASLKLEVDSHSFDVRGREYEVAIMRDDSPHIVVPKGAQLGLTIVFIIKCLHAIMQRRFHVLYLLPVKAGSVQFVQGRVDPLIDSNAELSSSFSRTDNRVQKVTQRGVKLYIRGTNIPSELREVPADILVLDERDVCSEENLADARERLSGSKWQRTYELSTPTIDGHGVYDDEEGYPASTRMRWWVPCPSCNSKQVLTFEDNIQPWIGDKASECECRCSHCGRVFSDSDRAAMNAHGQWVPEEPGREIQGYHVNQLNSPTKRLAVMMKNWFAGQTDSAALKAFYQLGLGLAYAAPGDRFSVELLNKCRQHYQLGGIPMATMCIGIDQGQEVLYVTEWVCIGATRRLHNMHLVMRDEQRTKWQVLDEDILQQRHNWVAVCDAHPDKEDCEALAKKYPEQFWMGFEKDRLEQPKSAVFNKPQYGDPGKVNIDRTMAFDTVIKQAIDGNMELPADAAELGERMPGKPYNAFYYQHLQMVRVRQADAADRIVARWVDAKKGAETESVSATAAARARKNASGKKADHWHHSNMFGWVASQADAPLYIPAAVGSVLRAAGGLIR